MMLLFSAQSWDPNQPRGLVLGCQSPSWWVYSTHLLQLPNYLVGVKGFLILVKIPRHCVVLCTLFENIIGREVISKG